MKIIPTEIEKRLKSLKDITSVREFFQALGYEYADQPIPTRNFKQELKDRIDENSLRLIAQYQGFPVLYCEVVVKGRGPKERQRHRTERLLLRAVPAQLTECLLITYDTHSKLWHFVNSKPFGSKLRLRRFSVGPHEKLRTASERLALVAVEPGDSWARLLSKHEEAFDRERVSDEFFNEYQRIFNKRKQEIAKRIGDEHAAHNFLQLFLNRLMFIYFIQRKGWLGSNGDAEFIKLMWNTYQTGSHKGDTFYEKWLTPLFFSALNNKKGYKRKGLPPEIDQVFDEAPYLNGGLFREQPDIDDINVHIPNELFAEVFENLLDRYNFTVQEDTPFDQSVSVDPEMLGIVYEKLVNVSDTKNEQASSGIFYTPRVEVDFMCRRSILEYLAKHADVSREALYHLLFAEEAEGAPEIEKSQRQELWKALRDVSVVDPACGSGAFLVGMMQVILDIERRLAEADGKVLDEFNEKKRIIERSLYGVDVKDWAIGVAQLRLWLSLIVEADEKKLDLAAMKIANDPLLPSLQFKIREGDSLVQEIAGKPLPIRGHAVELDQTTKGKITELRRLKTDFFFNRGDITERGLRRKERSVYVSVIDREIKKLEEERSRLKIPAEKRFQAALFKTSRGEQVDLSLVEEEEKRVAKRTKEIESRLEDLRKQRSDLANAGHLFWGIEFAEIFFENGKGGFDIVIGNPPYVRQERIADPKQENPSRDDKKAYKGKLLKAVQLDWPERPLKVGGQADLYVYFYLKSLALLNPQGTFCFITSNSWLDVAYGKDLQEFLVTRCPIYAIYDNQAKRSFKHADVNTTIVVFGAPGKPNSALSHAARFVMFRKSFEETVTGEHLLQIERAAEITGNDNFRVFPIKQHKLYEEGLQLDDDDKKNRTKLSKDWSAPYIGNKWGGKYLRAPDIYWKILEKGKGRLVRLGDISEVRYGIKTGANDFFYLDQDRINEWGIEEEFLKPVIKSPRECRSLLVDSTKLSSKIFICNKEKKDLRGTAALKYIKWGEKHKYHKTRSCQGRSQWWSLKIVKGNSLFVKEANNTSAVFYNPLGLPIDCRLYYSNLPLMTLFFLNSIIGAMMFEIYNRAGLGEGARSLMVTDYNSIPAIRTETLPPGISDALFKDLKPRSLYPHENNSTWKKIDEIIFDHLELTRLEQNALYEEVETLVRNRLKKAESFKA